MTSSLAVTDLRVGGHDGFVLGPLTFSVPDGAFLVVLGSAGSGKSLLLAALAGLVESSGSILAPSPVAMQFQRDALVDDEDVFTNVAACCVARGVQHPEARAHAVLEAVGLAEQMSASPRKLSGGQRRRAGLARALAVPSRLLLLDDPTAGLDPRTAREIAALIAPGAGRVVVCATHDVDGLVPRASHRIILERTGDGGRLTDGPAAADAPTPAALAQFAPRALELAW